MRCAFWSSGDACTQLASEAPARREAEREGATPPTEALLPTAAFCDRFGLVAVVSHL